MYATDFTIILCNINSIKFTKENFSFHLPYAPISPHLLYKECMKMETGKAGAPEEVIEHNPDNTQKSTLLNLTAESTTVYCPTHYPEIKCKISFK